MIAPWIAALTLTLAAGSSSELDPIDELVKLADQPQIPIVATVSDNAPKPPSEADKRSHYMVSGGVGIFQVQHAIAPGVKNWGGMLSGKATGDWGGAHVGGMFLYGMDVGVDGNGNNMLAFDLGGGPAVRLGRFSLGAFGGVGIDYVASSAADETQKPGQLLLPVSGYTMLGGRVAYTFDWVPFALEAIYAKVYRAADRMPREKRADVRWLIYGDGTPWSLTGRYVEYVDHRDPFFLMFNAKERTSQLWWFLVGVGL